MRTKAPRRQYFPQDWQKDPSKLETSKVQVWVNGSMVTAQMPLETARKRVSDGLAFVICSQTIGALDIETGECAS